MMAILQWWDDPTREMKMIKSMACQKNASAPSLDARVTIDGKETKPATYEILKSGRRKNRSVVQRHSMKGVNYQARRLKRWDLSG